MKDQETNRPRDQWYASGRTDRQDTPETLAAVIRTGVRPHLLDARGDCIDRPCVLCSLPTGPGWGEDELRRRIAHMGECVRAGMYGLRTFVQGGMTESDEEGLEGPEGPEGLRR